jgi:hypothetical protein
MAEYAAEAHMGNTHAKRFHKKLFKMVTVELTVPLKQTDVPEIP